MRDSIKQGPPRPSTPPVRTKPCGSGGGTPVQEPNPPRPFDHVPTFVRQRYQYIRERFAEIVARYPDVELRACKWCAHPIRPLLEDELLIITPEDGRWIHLGEFFQCDTPFDGKLHYAEPIAFHAGGNDLMLTQEDFDRLVAQGGCVFEIRGKVCKKAITPGSKYCPQHQAMLDAEAARRAAASPVSPRRKR